MTIRQFTLNSERERVESFFGTENEEISDVLKVVRKFVKNAEEADNTFPYDVSVRFDGEGVVFAEVRYTVF